MAFFTIFAKRNTLTTISITHKYMTIRLFNPDHDLALAANQKRFTAPHAGRKLREDLAFLPALWADDGDIVVVEDIDAAEVLYRKLKCKGKPDVEFCTLRQLPAILKDFGITSDGGNKAVGCPDDVRIDVWGWDAAICFQLESNGVPRVLMPSDKELQLIRELSNRRFSSSILKELNALHANVCGNSEYIADIEVFRQELLKRNNTCVVKAPWSCSGRGVRYFLGSSDSENTYMNTMSWASNVVAQQGGVMIEPYYNKVKDFAVEFRLDTSGAVIPVGLSLFDTRNGAYTGNMLATEDEKRDILSSYIDLSLLDSIVQDICRLTQPHLAPLASPAFDMHFGVDMMIIAKDDADGFLLHPCVEINLRRTMGLAALSISPTERDNQAVMSINYESKKYHLIIKNNFN